MFDQDTQRLVRIFQKVFNLSYVERDQLKYVKRYAHAIERAGQLFEYLGLAKLDKQSPLGWRPTPVLLDIMNKQSAPKSKQNDKAISVVDRLLMDLLTDVILGDDESHQIDLFSLGFDVLRELGLVREDRDGNMGPTRCLLRLFEDAYNKHT
jgi:DNA-binding transcriptional ArsR family regulator